MATRPGRQRSQLPLCYYEGYLEKRSYKDKTSQRLWASLCGRTLFFFNNNKDANYIEKLDLNGFISITDDYSRDRNLDAARLNLRLKDGDIKLTVPSPEARELWKGFIHSVVELSVPSSLNLLPGQIHMLRAAIEKEKERIKTVAPSPATDSNLYLSLHADMPACFHHVSRVEAEVMLERNVERGNLLLRPGRDGNSFAVTTRQDLDGSVFRHYRVTRKPDKGFAIDVDNPIPCDTLHDVINFLVEKTGGVLTPFIMEGSYENNITFIQSNEENGEKSVQECSALPSTVPNPLERLPPKPAFIQSSEANRENSVQCAVWNAVPTPFASLPPKPAPRQCAPIPEPDPETEENVYLNDSEEEEEEEKEREALRPPSRFHLPNNLDGRMRRIPVSSSQSDAVGQTISELKLKLERRRVLQE
ncbi:signal-transducing adaptor protein 1-like [Diretmus argenteus]